MPGVNCNLFQQDLDSTGYIFEYGSLDKAIEPYIHTDLTHPLAVFGQMSPVCPDTFPALPSCIAVFHLSYSRAVELHPGSASHNSLSVYNARSKDICHIFDPGFEITRVLPHDRSSLMLVLIIINECHKVARYIIRFVLGHTCLFKSDACFGSGVISLNRPLFPHTYTHTYPHPLKAFAYLFLGFFCTHAHTDRVCARN